MKQTKRNETNRKPKRQEETFGGNGQVYGIDCDDGFMSVYLFPNK